MNFTYDAGTKSYSATVDSQTAVEVGDKADPAKFKPAIKFKKFSDKSNFELELKSTNGTDQTSGQDKVKWKDADTEAEFYGLDPSSEHPAGALEFLIKFLSAPPSNVIEFKYKLKKANFFYQGPLTDLIGQDGVVTATETIGKNAIGEPIMWRSENVVGSYAVYLDASEKQKNEYKARKICHIYRPKITDSNSLEAWCELSIDEQKKEFYITIPPSFLAAAVYPIFLDPAVGYTVVGGSSVYFNSPGSLGHIGATLIDTPTSGYNRITKFSIYGSGTSYDAAAYTQSGGLPNTRLAAAVTIPFTGSPQWNDSPAVDQTLTNNTTYGMAWGAANNVTVYFDTGSGNQRSQENNDLPATWTSAGVSAAMYSAYYTFEQIEDMLL